MFCLSVFGVRGFVTHRNVYDCEIRLVKTARVCGQVVVSTVNWMVAINIGIGFSLFIMKMKVLRGFQ